MIAVNYSTARENFKKYCDTAVRDFETIIVTRKQGENVVIISESEYNNILENLHIRSNKEDYQRLLDSIADLKEGRNIIIKTMDELEAMEDE